MKVIIHREFDSIGQDILHQVVSLPPAELNGESNGKFGELKKMREAEFVGDVDTTMGRQVSVSVREKDTLGKRLTRWRNGYYGLSSRTRSRW